MRLEFHRGTSLRTDGASSVLRLDWSSERPEAFLLSDSRRSPYPLRRISDELYTCDDEEFGLIALAKTPWWSELPSPLPGRGVWMSYQGFASGVWHDGIFGRFEDSRWTDIVMPGPKFTLELGRSQLPLDDPDAFFHEERSFARKQSLICSLRHLFPAGFPLATRVEGRGSKADLVLGLLLIRLAFPDACFLLETIDVAWKRLAQNLNIKVPRSPGLGGPSLVLDSFGPQEKVLELLRWQQSLSPFIPQRLLASLVD